MSDCPKYIDKNLWGVCGHLRQLVHTRNGIVKKTNRPRTKEVAGKLAGLSMQISDIISAWGSESDV